MIGADVFGEEARAVDAHSLCVGAPTKLSRQAVRAVPAIDIRVHRHLLSRVEARHLAANFLDLTDRLVARGKRIDTDVGPMVQVHICTAHTCLIDLDPNIKRADRWHRHVGNGEVPRRLVPNGLHESVILITRSARGMLFAMITALSWSVVCAQVSACSWFMPCN